MVKIESILKTAGKKFSSRRLFSTFILTLLVFSALSFLPTIKAQAPYKLTREIGVSSTNYVWIMNVKANDEVEITVSPPGDPYYQSAVSYKNLTQIQYDDGLAGTYNDIPYGRHNHEFLAPEDGDYLFTIWTNSGYTFNYTITSNYHVLVAQNMSTSMQTIGFSETNIFWINAVKANDLVFVTVSPPGDPYYQSLVSYRNLTVIQSDDGLAGTYNDIPYGRHEHEFIATEDGDYRLKIWTDSGNAFNYTISYVHQDPADVSQGTTPSGSSPTRSPSPSPSVTAILTSAPTNSVPLNITANTGAQVTFEVPASYSGVTGNFTYDFGDGKNLTTSDRTVTHIYESLGNYTFTLRLADVPEKTIIESYAVTIKNPDSSGGLTLDKLEIPIIGGVSVFIIGAVLKFSYGRLHGKVQGNKNKEEAEKAKAKESQKDQQPPSEDPKRSSP